MRIFIICEQDKHIFESKVNDAIDQDFKLFSPITFTNEKFFASFEYDEKNTPEIHFLSDATNKTFFKRALKNLKISGDLYTYSDLYLYIYNQDKTIKMISLDDIFKKINDYNQSYEATCSFNEKNQQYIFNVTENKKYLPNDQIQKKTIVTVENKHKETAILEGLIALFKNISSSRNSL